MKPVISVVVPVYQVEAYIENSIKSICNQSFNSFEIILVNDGTKDNSIEIAEKILKVMNTPYHIINQENKGVSAARNAGIKNAKGEWVVCVDPDDIINKEFLNILYSSVNRHYSLVSIGNYLNFSSINLLKEPDRFHDSCCVYKDSILKLFLKRKINIITPAMLIKKELFYDRQLWFDEKMSYSEDQHHIWRVLFAVDYVTYNKTPIYNYYVRPGSTMTASNQEKIITGYNGFLVLIENLKKTQNKTFCDLIMTRWVFGALHSAARMMGYEEWKILANTMDYNKYIRKLSIFPDIRVRGLALVMAINLKLAYFIFKKM